MVVNGRVEVTARWSLVVMSVEHVVEWGHCARGGGGEDGGESCECLKRCGHDRCNRGGGCVST